MFAGGIRENASTVRARICDGPGFLGIKLEINRNAANDAVISMAACRVAVCVIRYAKKRIYSVGANPTRQLTVRAVVKEAENLTGGRKQR